MIKRVVIPLFAFFVIIIIGGVGLVYFRKSSSQPTTSPSTKEANPTPEIKISKESIKTKAGENFSIILMGDTASGYEWKFDFDPNYITFVDKKIELLVGEKGVSGIPNKGTYTFTSIRPADTEITALYIKPEEADVPPEEIIIFQLKIE